MDTSSLTRLPPDASTHFALSLHSAIVALIARLAREHDGLDAAFERFAFLGGYVDQLARHGLDGVTLGRSLDAWRAKVERWEREVAGHLPLRALKNAYRLDAETVELLLATGLVDEDARFGAVFASLPGASGERPSTAVLAELHEGLPGRGRARM